jgi:hypothetical protein
MAERKGYVRPSPVEAGVGPQIEVLKAAGAETLFEEELLSGEADRPALRRALDSLGPGDTLLVASLDRLARTTTELFYILEEIVKRGAALLSLREGLRVGADDAAISAEAPAGGLASDGATDVAATNAGAPGPADATASAEVSAGAPVATSADGASRAFMRDLSLIIDFERVSLREWQRESIEGTKARRERGSSGARRRR